MIDRTFLQQSFTLLDDFLFPLKSVWKELYCDELISTKTQSI